MSLPTGERRWRDAAEHVQTYRASDGAQGHTWAGRPHLLLSTTGRRSGREHTVPLVYARLGPAPGDPLVVAASAGGAEHHPAWFLNLEAEPRVGVQLWERRWSVMARVVAEEAERERAWAAMSEVWSGFTRYREQTRRRIPVVLLEQAPGAGATH